MKFDLEIIDLEDKSATYDEESLSTLIWDALGNEKAIVRISSHSTMGEQVNIYCSRCKKKQTNYDKRFPINIPFLDSDKQGQYRETDVKCPRCGHGIFFVKKVISHDIPLEKVITGDDL